MAPARFFVLPLLLLLGLGSCRGIPTFLVDADVADDGVVTTADVATVIHPAKKPNNSVRT